MSTSSFSLRAAALLGVVAAIQGIAPDVATAQCSMCVTALEQNPEAAAGFNRAILFLLAMPYAVFGSLAGYVVLSRRRRAARSQPEAAARPAGAQALPDGALPEAT